METGMNGGPEFGSWQHCHGGILHIFVVNIVSILKFSFFCNYPI
jgi:hypothetical protein